MRDVLTKVFFVVKWFQLDPFCKVFRFNHCFGWRIRRFVMGSSRTEFGVGVGKHVVLNSFKYFYRVSLVKVGEFH